MSFQKKYLNLNLNLSLLSNYLILLSIFIRNGLKISEKNPPIIDFVYLYRWIICLLNQLAFLVYYIMRVSSIFVIVQIRLLLVNWYRIASVLFSNILKSNINFLYCFPITNLREEWYSQLGPNKTSRTFCRSCKNLAHNLLNINHI